MTHRISVLPQVSVIADDLTSAADGGCPFLRKGCSVEVVRRAYAGTGDSSADVVSVDCGSRSMPARQAARTAGEAAAALRHAPLLFKTIDSALRGHIREELRSVYRESGRERLVVAPAFPEAGRTTRNGILFVDGRPVAESTYASDPVHPATTSRIADLVPGGVRDLTILDAGSQEELTGKVAAIERPDEVLWVGSPGLARALADLKEPAQIRTPPPVASAGLTLVAVGSANPVSREQFRRVEALSGTICLSAPEGRAHDPQKVLQEIADQASQCLQDPAVSGLVATGGDTMEALLERLNIGRFALVGELEAGFPVGSATLADGRRLLLGMKAGGFGTPDTLHKAVERLRQGIAAQRSEVR